MIRFAFAVAALLALPAQAADLKETPSLAVDVAAGKLPPVQKRVPEEPLVVAMDGKTMRPGKQGGELRMLVGRARDVRMLSVYGYARLVGYDPQLELHPDILQAVEVDDERSYTLKLRKGHKWSNGDPFTTEDFRYWWEDVANNADLSPAGPPIDMLAEGEKPKVEIIDAQTIRYTWTKRNPFFLPRLAAASPLFIFRPSSYLKQFHAKYAEPEKLKAAVVKARMRGWPQLHNKVDNLFEMDQPDLPTLEPWMIVTRPPAIRFTAERNPFFHRVDPNGVQLPYADRIIMNQSDSKLIAAKAAAGEVDLQARNISFNNFTFLKENEKRSGYQTLLWRTAKGSHVALLPNLNAIDPVWRALNRDVRFRHALSMGIDREGVNQSLYFGLAVEGNNTMLPGSPLYRDEYLKAWTKFDLKAANKLLDEIGLIKRDSNKLRLLPDGRPMEIIIETAGEDSEQTDVLELIAETWAKLGIRLLPKPSQREVLYNRVFSGETVMSVQSGFENGIATAAMSPGELAPTGQWQLQWPKWGQFYETKGQLGETPDIPAAADLLRLHREWLGAAGLKAREAAWHQMLKIHAENTFTIGVISAVYQPVVKVKSLRNVPEEGIYNFDPGAFFGMYRPDTFWFDR